MVLMFLLRRWLGRQEWLRKGFERWLMSSFSMSAWCAAWAAAISSAAGLVGAIVANVRLAEYIQELLA